MTIWVKIKCRQGFTNKSFRKLVWSQEITLVSSVDDTSAEACEPDMNEISPINDPACNVDRILPFCLILTDPDMCSLNSGASCSVVIICVALEKSDECLA